VSPRTAAAPAPTARNGHDAVPFVRLDNADPELLAELTDAVAGVAARAAFTLGSEVEEFEHEFGAYCGGVDAVGVSSGTEAIVLALRALGIGAGDEVIVPANSFIATAEAVTLVGATPRLVDVDLDSGLVTPEIVERALAPRTRCLIPVHLYGATADMPALTSLARDAGIAVVEDACQAHGAWIDGRRVGTWGDFGCFSFYPTKNLGGWGDGGAVVAADAELADRVRLLRSHGEPAGARNSHRVPGTTARLDAVQAAVLRIKLRRLDDWNAARRAAAADLTQRLAGVPVAPPAVPDGGDHVFHLFVARSPHRDELRDRLAALGVASAIHYPVPIHLTEAYAELGLGPGSLPAVERRALEICSLPFFPAIAEDELQRVALAVEASARS
jgi:dTDP-3-amino-3,4,6-trideoxy-alpha-D-glucose transaminase